MTYPPVDPRRTRALRADLLADIAALAPAWRGAAEESGPDRALVEIAARLAEHATRRLDRTPERDALAFLAALDIPPPEPRSAEGHAVFALAEDRSGSEVLKAGAKLEIENAAGDAPAPFKTVEDLPVHAARIAYLAAIDTAADTINRAPPQVTTLEPKPRETVTYVLQSTAGAGDRVIRLSHAVGIAPADLLRVAMADDSPPVFLPVLEVAEDGLVTLAAPLDTALDPDAVGAITRMISFEPFAMPDHQAHALYLGDGEALQVSEPANITLTLDPAEGSPALFDTGVELEAWGIREAPDPVEEAPRWHRLPRIAASGQSLTFRKGWTGPLEELELSPGVKSRWLRIRRVDPIGRGAGEMPVLDGVRLSLETDKPSAPADETISQAAYNATPLPLPECLPFGAEPRRFDTFALAAPETFTKHGATAHLTFDLLDATLMQMAASIRLDGNRHLFGIGANRRIQLIDLNAKTQFWREGRGPRADGAPARLDPGFAPRAAEYVTPGDDFDRNIVVVADTAGQLWSSVMSIRREGGDPAQNEWGESDWSALPAPPGGTLDIVAVPLRFGSSEQVSLFHHDGTTLHRLRLGFKGEPLVADWYPVPLDPGGPADLGPSPVFVPVTGSYDEKQGRFGAVDADGRIWLFRISAGQGTWQELTDGDGDPLFAAPGSVPAFTAFEIGSDPHVGLAWFDGVDTRFAAFELVGDAPVFFRSDSLPVAADAVAIASGILIGEWPTVMVSRATASEPVILEWTPDTVAPADGADVIVHALPAGTIRDPLALALFPGDADLPAELVLGGQAETYFRMTFNRSTLAEFRTWIATGTDGLAPDPADLADLEVAWAGFENGASVHRVEPARFLARHPDTGHWIAGIPDGGRLRSDRPIRLTAGHGPIGTPADFNDGGATVELAFDSTLADAPAVADGDHIFAAIGGRQIVVRCASATTDGGTGLTTVTFDGDEAAWLTEFMDGAASTAIDVVDLVSEVAPDSPAHYDTLALVLKPGSAPDAIIVGLDATRPISFGEEEAGAGPDDPGPRIALDPDDPESLRPAFHAAVLPAWTSPPPPDAVVKILDMAGGESVQGFAPETLIRTFAPPELAWEYYDGRGWKRLRDVLDGTDNLSGSGEIAFTVPPDLSPVEIGGQDDLWVRARLVDGDYGRPQYVVTSESSGSTTVQSVSVETDHMRPPEIARMTAHFTDMPPEPPATVIARNNLRDIDQSAANRTAGAVWPVFLGIGAGAAGRGTGRALLLGLSRTLPAGLVTLYVTAEDQETDATLRVETLGPDLAWAEAPLAAEDPTRGLSQSGLLKFSVTVPPEGVALFDTSAPRHWLRLSIDRAEWAPRITGMWLNGTPILQAETITQELLGNSLGEPNAEFRLLKSPVLRGSLELRVREDLSGEEIEELRATADPDGPDPVLTDVRNIPGTWVLWSRVQTLAGAGGARVYLAQPDGTIRFGDGTDGRIPPARADAIRAFQYRTGGLQVDCAEMTEVKSRQPLPGQEIAFLPHAIAGGAVVPPPATLVARMPEALRHRGAGLSLADLEALARDIDSDIRQCRADHAPDGTVRVTVLATGDGRAPGYGRAKRDDLARALSRAASDAWGPDCITVVPARIVPIAVNLRLTARAGQATRLETAARSDLELLLHAADGGPDGVGWPIGSRPWPVDLERVLARCAAFDRLVSAEITAPDGGPLGPVGPDAVAALVSTAALSLEIREEAAP
ncbi:hypothetical protein HKCCE3408_15655 [Rhodobacterales bacterium HKCCE3408]|nr:hypothetical protein [Rhodobacterales bacterium HKCCE3408]